MLYIPPPDLEARHEILHVHTRKMKVGNDLDLKQIAEDTELFTGAELQGLCNEAGMVAMREGISSDTIVCNRHFKEVLRSLKPALSREDVDSYASFLKNPYLRCESTGRRESKATTRFFRAAPVAIAILGMVLYTGFKGISVNTDSALIELART